MVTEDHQYEWVAGGFDALGPRIKNRSETEQFMSAMFGKVLKNYQVRALYTFSLTQNIQTILPVRSSRLHRGTRKDNVSGQPYH
jgi:hypothetical protein